MHAIYLAQIHAWDDSGSVEKDLLIPVCYGHNPVRLSHRLPGIIGSHGDRRTYQLLIPVRQLIGLFPTQFDDDARTTVQRPMKPARAKEIARYILENPGHVLGSLTYAVSKNLPFERADGDRIGHVVLPGESLNVLIDEYELRCLDGQHRRAGIQLAYQERPNAIKDDIAITIYVEPNRANRRQMFSDMNATAKRVAGAINVKFDGRDPFARAACRVAESGLLAGHIETERASVNAASDKYFSLKAIYDSLKTLFVGPDGRVRNPSEYGLVAIMKAATVFTGFLFENRPEFAKLDAGIEPYEIRESSILLSSTTLRVVAGGLHLRANEDSRLTGRHPPSSASAARYGNALRRINFDPRWHGWARTGFVSPGKKTPNSRNQEMRAAMTLVAQLLNR
jgi:DNA sulfur modification protein DndB